MVMIDRMFIQEEKIALSQDKILAKERPGILNVYDMFVHVIIVLIFS